MKTMALSYIDGEFLHQHAFISPPPPTVTHILSAKGPSSDFFPSKKSPAEQMEHPFIFLAVTFLFCSSFSVAGLGRRKNVFALSFHEMDHSSGFVKLTLEEASQ